MEYSTGYKPVTWIADSFKKMHTFLYELDQPSNLSIYAVNSRWFLTFHVSLYCHGPSSVKCFLNRQHIRQWVAYITVTFSKGILRLIIPEWDPIMAAFWWIDIDIYGEDVALADSDYSVCDRDVVDSWLAVRCHQSLGFIDQSVSKVVAVGLCPPNSRVWVTWPWVRQTVEPPADQVATELYGTVDQQL